MSGFTKLFSTIVTSSIWSEDDKTRIMWITMLASADSSGKVSGSIPGMAAIARMKIEDAERSIKALCSPDPYSRSKEHEGRRLIEVDGGWLIVNYAKYRQRRDPEKRRDQNREAKRRQRQREQTSAMSATVSDGQQASAAVSSGQNDAMLTQSVNPTPHKDLEQKTVSQSQPKSAQAEAEAEADFKNPPISPLGDKGKNPGDSGCQKIAPEIQRVFEAWNQHAGKAVRKPDGNGTTAKISWRGHKKLSSDKVAAIRQALKDYAAADIIGAINNFSTVLLDRKSYWSYPWTLNEFLTRGRERHKQAERQWWQFLPDNFDAERYRRHGPESEVVYEDPSVEEGLEIARQLDQQAAERDRRAAV